jgi:hypothetical protein
MFRVFAFAIVILSTVSAAPVDRTASADPALQIEREKVAVEREKLTLEREKLGFERERQKESTSIEADKLKWAAIGTMIPILAALGTLWYGIYSVKRTVSAQLATKLAELALGGSGSWEIVNRARFATHLFSELLPPEFINKVDKMDPAEISPGPSRKGVVIELLAKHPTQRDQILADFKAAYGDAWIDILRAGTTT